MRHAGAHQLRTAPPRGRGSRSVSIPEAAPMLRCASSGISGPHGPRERRPGTCAPRGKRGRSARIELLPGFAPGLAGLGVGQAIQVLLLGRPWPARPVSCSRRATTRDGKKKTPPPRAASSPCALPSGRNPIALGTVVITLAGRGGRDHRHRRDGCLRRDARARHQAVDFHCRCAARLASGALSPYIPPPWAKAADNPELQGDRRESARALRLCHRGGISRSASCCWAPR